MCYRKSLSEEALAIAISLGEFSEVSGFLSCVLRLQGVEPHSVPGPELSEEGKATLIV